MGSSIRRSPESRTVTANGLRLHVHDWGGLGPFAVLLHATGFHGRVWDPIARELATTHRVIALDQRGHGESDPARDDYRWERFADDAIAACDALGIRDALAVGHSMGATVAAAAAARRPDLFTRLVLLDMILFPRDGRDGEPDENPLAAVAQRRRMDWPSREAMLESYAPRPPFDTWTDEVLRLYVERGTRPGPAGVRLSCEAETEAQIFEGGTRFRIAPLLPRIEAPTLVVRGERSEVLGDGDLARVVGQLRRGRAEVAPDTTHFIPMERPDRVVAAIREFLARLPEARSG